MSEQPKTRIYSLQWLRFVAALGVVFYHASVYLQMMTGSDWAVGFVPSWAGVIGVSLFFALSGNLMASAMMRQDAPTFLLHRVARIYPAFFLAVLLFYVAATVSPIKAGVDWLALTLLPAGPTATYPLGVEWTLVFEIVFYVFVFGLVLFKKQAQAVSALVGWLGLILIHNILWPDDPTVNLYSPRVLPFVSANVAFAAGMLLPLVLKRQPHPILALILAVAMWLVGGVLLGVNGSRWGIGFGAALLVLSLARFAGWRWAFGPNLLGLLGNRLGDYSYALYLCHVPVIRTVYALFPSAPAALLFSCGSAIAFLVSIPLGEADIRFYRFMKSKVDETSPALRAILAFIYLTAFCGVAIWTVSAIAD